MKTKSMLLAVSTVALFALSLADASAASVRVRCEKGSGYSKISVDGRDLTPGSRYKARVSSGASVKITSLKVANVNGEAEFDLNSKPNDIAAGATAISSTFIKGNPPRVTGKILDADNFMVASDTVDCRVK